MTIGSTLLTPEQATRIVDVWLATVMREPRYIRRLTKIRRLEQDH
jgi:ribose 5-phosphate isomerase RpiB